MKRDSVWHVVVLTLNSPKGAHVLSVAVYLTHQLPTSFLSNYIYLDIILLDLVQNLTKDWMPTELQRNGASQSTELITQLIIMMYAILSTRILKLGMRLTIKSCCMSLIVLWTLTERIDKSIVGKLIKAKANFELCHRIKIKTSP